MSSDWYNWRVIITATQQADYVLRTEEQGAPIVGPGGEPIDTAKSRIVGHREDGEIKIKEMNVLTGGRYQVKHTKVSAPPNQTTVHNISFPTDINLASAIFAFTSASKGDIICWAAAPNTTAGALTAPTTINDTVLSVSQTVIDNIDELFRVRLALASDPTNTYEDVGKVLSIDEVNSTITIDTPVTQVWVAGTTLVQMTQIFIDDVEIGPLDTRIKTGQDTVRTSHVPAGTVLHCEYKNVHPTDTHELYVYFSYFYGRVKAS